MLNLKKFEEQIASVILQRGLQYYKQGAVTDLEETDDNIWEADVEGSEIYSVEIEIKNGTQVSEYVCDCPYDGAVCKHVAAVLFAIRDELKQSGSEKKKPAAKTSLERLLQKITIKEYQDFIRQYASRDKDFKTEFELHFSDKDDSIDVEKKYAELVRKIINKHSYRGYIDYRSTSGLAGDIDKLYHTGTDLIKHNNFSDAFALAKPLLKSMMEAITESDDSNGSIGETIDDAISLLEMIADADKAARALKEQIFFFLKTELNNKLYFNYGDFGYNMFTVLEKLAVQLNNAEEFLSFIDAQLPELTGEYDNYQADFFQTEKIAFLKATGKTNDAEKLILQNLDIIEIRQGEVNNAISKKDYKLAKQLVNDGIEVAEDKKHPGTVNQWMKELLRIAVLEKDTEAVRHYAKYFAFDRWFNKEYYNQWKKTYHPQEWKQVIEIVIDEKIKKVTQEHQKNKSKFWYQPNPPLLQEIPPIYAEELYWDRLLSLVQKENNLDTVLQYHEDLVKIYPLALLAIYLPLCKPAEIKQIAAGNMQALLLK